MTIEIKTNSAGDFLDRATVACAALFVLSVIACGAAVAVNLPSH